MHLQINRCAAEVTCKAPFVINVIPRLPSPFFGNLDATSFQQFATFQSRDTKLQPLFRRLRLAH
jgi:hypothetical protein